MGNTNYISTIVKILETPNKTFFNNTIPVTRFRAQLPQLKNTQIVNLICWGNLAINVDNFYQANDYILIDGYLSFNNRDLLTKPKEKSKKVEITILKVYTFSNSLISKK